MFVSLENITLVSKKRRLSGRGVSGADLLPRSGYLIKNNKLFLLLSFFSRLAVRGPKKLREAGKWRASRACIFFTRPGTGRCLGCRVLVARECGPGSGGAPAVVVDCRVVQRSAEVNTSAAAR